MSEDTVLLVRVMEQEVGDNHSSSRLYQLSQRALPLVQTNGLGSYNLSTINGSLACELTDCGCDGLQCYPQAVFNAVTIVTVVLAAFGFLGNGLTVLAILASSLRVNLNR